MKLLKEDVEAVLRERIEADEGFNLFVFAYFRTNDRRVFASPYEWLGDDTEGVVLLGNITEWDAKNYAWLDASSPDLVNEWEAMIIKRIEEALKCAKS
jgi:hypothetical protein